MIADLYAIAYLSLGFFIIGGCVMNMIYDKEETKEKQKWLQIRLNLS